VLETVSDGRTLRSTTLGCAASWDTDHKTVPRFYCLPVSVHSKAVGEQQAASAATLAPHPRPTRHGPKFDAADVQVCGVHHDAAGGGRHINANSHLAFHLHDGAQEPRFTFVC